MPVIGCHLAVTAGSEIFYWLVPGIWFVVVPIFDLVLLREHDHLSHAVVTDLGGKHDFSWLSGLTVPIVYATLLFCAWMIAPMQGQPIALLGTGLSLGVVFWILVTFSCAYVPQENRIEKILSFLASGIVGFGHFRLAHSVTHRQACGTPLDHSSARMGENLYRFILRSSWGAMDRAWRYEKERLADVSPIKALFGNEILQSLVFAIALHGGLIAVFGAGVAGALAVAIISAWFLHSVMNYVQHYGLLREKCEDGTYVSFSPKHTWNSRHLASALILFNGTCQADPHSHPERHFQLSRAESESPKLPLGFATMMMAAMLPPLWFRTMDAVVAQGANGDLQKVNIDGDAYADLMERYHRPRA